MIRIVKRGMYRVTRKDEDSIHATRRSMRRNDHVFLVVHKFMFMIQDNDIVGSYKMFIGRYKRNLFFTISLHNPSSLEGLALEPNLCSSLLHQESMKTSKNQCTQKVFCKLILFPMWTVQV